MKTYAILLRTRLCGHVDGDAIHVRSFSTLQGAWEEVFRLAEEQYQTEKRCGSNVTCWSIVDSNDDQVKGSVPRSSEVYLKYGDDDLYDEEVVESYEIFEVEVQ